MSGRTASCRCGRLRATVSGDPVRVSVCHCLNCKKRSGSAFSVQARWPSQQVRIQGRSNQFEQPSDNGNRGIFRFCPDCGSDVYYTNAGPGIDADFANLVAIPVGAFDDPFFAWPQYSVWEQRKHPWVEILGEQVEHFD